MKIELNQGRVLLIDDEFAPLVSAHKWFATKDGYVRRTVNDRSIYLHRIITNAAPGMEVDHINGDKLDNRKSNLRVCLPSQNKKNAQKSPKARTSRYKGVSLSRRKRLKWVAQIKYAGKAHHLGTFATEIDAALAYNQAAIAAFGEFAGLNVIK